MTLALLPLTPFEPGYAWVLRSHALIRWTWLFPAALAAEWWFADELWATGLLSGLALLVVLWRGVLAPQLYWRSCGYAFTGRELHIAAGVLVEVYTIVPVARVQHLDATQGPIERLFGVRTLSVFTAGTDASQVVLPGLSAEAAETIRDAIREQISG
jgi:uncharacterized protein